MQLRKAICLVLCAIMATGSLSLIPVSNVNALSNPAALPVHRTYALADNFNDGNLDGWIVSKMHSSTTVEIVNGVLHVQNEAWAGWCLNHTLNAAKQSLNYSFEFMCQEGQGPIAGPPALFVFKSFNFGQSPATLWSWWALIATQLTNQSIEFSYDDGTLEQPPVILTGGATPPLVYGTWYRWYVEFMEPGWDRVHVRIYNRATDALFCERIFWTFYTSSKSNNFLPDELVMGNPSLLPNFYQNWYFDNMTMTQDSPDSSGSTSPSIQNMNSAIDGFGQRVLSAEIGPSIFNEGGRLDFPDWTTNPTYKLNATSNCSGRDDVAGDMIELGALLFERTGDWDYLTFAGRVWNALVTHRQADGGWTFGNWTVDYSDSDGDIINGLLALYRVTGDHLWLDEASEGIPWLLAYQRPFGDVYGRVDRASPWNPTTDYSGSETNSSWFTSSFVITLLHYYYYTGNITVYNAALNASDWIAGSIPESGRPLVPRYSGYFEADFNDVSATGTNLRALVAAYAASDNESYLDKARNVSKILVWSQWTNQTEGYGFWTGWIKERYNQADLLYNYQSYLALAEYLPYAAQDRAEILGAINASLAFIMSAQGHTVWVQGGPLFDVNGLWGGSWNANDTSDQGWTSGWFNEGGWGTWGTVAFFSWQANMVRLLLIMNADEPEPSDTVHQLQWGLILPLLALLVICVLVGAAIYAYEAESLDAEKLIILIIGVIVTLVLISALVITLS